MALSIYLFRDLVITVLFTEQFRSARELFLLQLVGDVIKLLGFFMHTLFKVRGILNYSSVQK